MKIYKVFDNGGATVDRYTVVFTEFVGHYRKCLSLSAYPDWPLGVSMWGECIPGEHLGEEIQLEDLPERLREHVLERIEED